jgi:tripartite-type tricarboxylate transporter receptor subunit TctC
MGFRCCISVQIARAVAGILVATLSCNPAWVQPHAERTIKIVVPYPPGGGTDSVARVLADRIGRAQGLTMLIENRPGASTATGTEALSRAAADGSTLLIADTNFIINPHSRKVNYDPRTSFEPICHLVSSPQVLAVNGTSSYFKLADLFGAARERPGTLTLASIEPGSLPQIEFERLKRSAYVDITFIPHPGAAPALNALLGGHVTSVLISYGSLGEQLKAGTVRALAAAAGRRMAALPDVPTVAESGYKDIEADLWDGVLAPAGTPNEIVTEIAGWFTAALREPETERKLSAQGFIPVRTCGSDFGAAIRKQYDDFGRFIRQLNIKAE